MTAIDTEDRLRTRLLLAQRTQPRRDRAMVCALLRVLGVPYAEAEIIAPVEAPIDVQFRQAQFHLRELCDHPQACVWQARDTLGHQASRRADKGDLPQAAVGIDLTVSVSHIAAALAQHAEWYGARCVGLDAVVAVDGHQCVLAPLTQLAEINALPMQGWRSVSVVCPPYGMVVYAASTAPDFLRAVTWRLLRQGDYRTTLGDKASMDTLR
jgi:Putative endonuclease, protein of unknown function (DUF1780)